MHQVRAHEHGPETFDQSIRRLFVQDDSDQNAIGVPLDLLGRGLQPYGRAVSGGIGCREAGHQIRLLAEIVEQLLAKLRGQRSASGTQVAAVIWHLLRNAAKPAIEDRQKYQGQRASTTATRRSPRWPAASGFPIRGRKRTAAG